MEPVLSVSGPFHLKERMGWFILVSEKKEALLSTRIMLLSSSDSFRAKVATIQFKRKQSRADFELRTVCQAQAVVILLRHIAVKKTYSHVMLCHFRIDESISHISL